MRRLSAGLSLLPLVVLLLTGCSPIGNKSAGISVIYGVVAVLSLLLLVCYCCVVKKKGIWYLLLFTSVLVVNGGYFALSVSGGLEQALFANRLSYLGSVFLPLSMLMIIMNATHIRCKKWIPYALSALALTVFLIAASPGYLPIYYKEVSFVVVDGVAKLQKVYGPLHCLYLVYLLGYFAAMISIIVYATVKDKIDSLAYAVIIAIAVFVNIGVWFLEQLVRIDFEILSVSYIVSECFLMGLHLLMVENEKQKARILGSIAAKTRSVPNSDVPIAADPAQIEMFVAGAEQLTPTERIIYDYYTAGQSTKEIMTRLRITENTLKFHNKNIYSKLGISSRKQLVALHKQIHSQDLPV